MRWRTPCEVVDDQGEATGPFVRVEVVSSGIVAPLLGCDDASLRKYYEVSVMGGGRAKVPTEGASASATPGDAATASPKPGRSCLKPVHLAQAAA